MLSTAVASAAAAPRRPALRLAGAFVGAALVLALATGAAAPVRAAVGDVIVRGGYAARRVMLSGDYGGFLGDRYGVDYVDLTGTTLAVLVQDSPDMALGAEVSDLDGDFTYRTLNGVEETGSLAVQEAVLKLLYLTPGSGWEWGLGGGLSRLTRSLYGYQGPHIVTTNLGSNSGRADVTTTAPTVHGEVVRRFGGRLSLDVGLRATYSPHDISAGDERPAYDDKGRPTSATFNVGGLGYRITLTGRF